MAILETYFDVEDGEEENLAPAVAEGGELLLPGDLGWGSWRADEHVL